MIRNLALVLGLLVGIGAPAAHAGQLGDFFDSLFQKQNFVFLESASPIFFYDLQNGENKTHTGIVSPWYKWHFLSADAGWLTGNLDQSPFKDGSPLLGGTVHIDQLIGTYLPTVPTFLYAITPDSSHALLKRITIGYGFSHDFAQQKFINGIYSGLEWKF